MSDPGTWSPTVSTLCKQNKSPVRIAICRGRGVAARPCSLQRPHPLTANGCTQRRKDATDQSPVGHLKWAGGMQVQATTPHSLSRLSIKACEKRDYRPFGLVAPWLILLLTRLWLNLAHLAHLDCTRPIAPSLQLQSRKHSLFFNCLHSSPRDSFTSKYPAPSSLPFRLTEKQNCSSFTLLRWTCMPVFSFLEKVDSFSRVTGSHWELEQLGL